MKKSWYARYVHAFPPLNIPLIALIAQICTELLYQPLTLLDCLHTFCGSCVKEWFSAQGSRRPSRRSPRFTCPSCRAGVRDTRPNATVTTLLDMVLGPHPDRARSTEEKAEIAKRYTHGESVFPTLASDGESAEDDHGDDARMLEEVRELSLRESRAQSRRGTHRTTHSSRTRESGHTERHAEDGRSRRRREERSIRPDDQDRSRRIEHQSSLRSLLSLSSDVETMEEEILRQILEDGLLDHIDLHNLGPGQEEELTERIAEAYRQRHMQQSRTGQRQDQDPRQEPDAPSRTHRSESTHRTTDPTPATREQSNRRPPASRPHLLNAAPTRPSISGHQRRNSEQGSGRRRTSPLRTNQASMSDDAIRPAARSSSDITADRTHMSQTGRLRSESSSARPRRATESGRETSGTRTAGGRDRSSSRQTSQSVTGSPTASTTPSAPAHHSTSIEHNPPLMSPPPVPIRSDRRTRPSSSRSNAPAAVSPQYVEPSISCDSCGKTGIQYDLHKRCPKCKDGNFHLCIRCYRLGHGCHQWSGFSTSAQINFQRMVSSSTQRPVQLNESAHIMAWFKYERPSETTPNTMVGERQMTSDNPAGRLQSGLFCDTCQSTANDCFWKCSKCNDGDWGFCNFCVNRGRCCTHPLLPIRRITESSPSSASSPTTNTSTPQESSVASSSPPEIENFKILSFSTRCDICTYPIPASNTRHHCLECHDGDYDVCTNCYLKMVAMGKISKENGHNGWRRCPAGHRMITVGFEDREEGQHRVIVRDLVGGRALKDEHLVQSQSPATSAVGGTLASPESGIGDWCWKEGAERRKKTSRLRAGALANISGGHVSASDLSNPSGTATGAPIQSTLSSRRFPPDGGVGLIVQAIWSWYPEEEVEDELVFPRGADITEAENINDDWFWGCYAGRTGLFPGAHVRLVREVSK